MSEQLRRIIQSWSRSELVEYLENWGYQVYDSETLEELQDSAYQNAKTEGDIP